VDCAPVARDGVAVSVRDPNGEGLTSGASLEAQELLWRTL